MSDLGRRMVGNHLAEMTAMSGKKWPAIVERDGFRIVEDRPYQGFDGNGPGPKHPWWPEPRFWCRSIIVERIADGQRAVGIGPQADAYEMAIEGLAQR